MYFLFLSSFLTNSERSGELEENEDEKKNHTCVNGVYGLLTPGSYRGAGEGASRARMQVTPGVILLPCAGNDIAVDFETRARLETLGSSLVAFAYCF